MYLKLTLMRYKLHTINAPIFRSRAQQVLAGVHTYVKTANQAIGYFLHSETFTPEASW